MKTQAHGGVQNDGSRRTISLMKTSTLAQLLAPIKKMNIINNKTHLQPCVDCSHLQCQRTQGYSRMSLHSPTTQSPDTLFNLLGASSNMMYLPILFQWNKLAVMMKIITETHR